MSENVERNLSSRQNKAIESLLDGANLQDAAAAAGVNPKTLSRWLNYDVLFFETLQNHSRASIQRASLRLNGVLDTAVDALLDVMQNPAQKAGGVKLRAANYLIGHCVKLAELSDVLKRLDELEARLP